MNRKRRRRQITDLVTPLLDEGEEAARRRRRLGGATRADPAPAHRSPPPPARAHRPSVDRVPAAPTARPTRRLRCSPSRSISSRSRGARARFTLYQVLVVTSDGRRYVLEFRRRDHATGHALSRMLAASHGGREWPSCSRSTPGQPACAPWQSTSTAARARTRTASLPSTSRNRVGSSTTPTTSGARCPTRSPRSSPRSTAKRSRRSGSRTSARQPWCGIAATGAPLHRALVWQDRRTAERCDALRAAGHEPLVRARTGLVLDPYFSATKLEWLLTTGWRRAPPTLAFGTVDSWILWNLTGGAAGACTPPNRRTRAARCCSTSTRSAWSPGAARAVRRPGVVPPRGAPDERALRDDRRRTPPRGCTCPSAASPATSRRRCSGRRASHPA